MSETWFEDVFVDPDRVGQTEYLAIYEVVEVFKDDPQMVASILQEFRGWATTMLTQMQDQDVVRKVVSEGNER
ncbi:MAG: hypothetical protein ACE5LU_22650 [Anaerolineae bacterium]